VVPRAPVGNYGGVGRRIYPNSYKSRCPSLSGRRAGHVTRFDFTYQHTPSDLMRSVADRLQRVSESGRGNGRRKLEKSGSPLILASKSDPRRTSTQWAAWDSNPAPRIKSRKGRGLLSLKVAVADVGKCVVQEHMFGTGRWGCDCTRPEDRSNPPGSSRGAGGESYLSARDRTQEPLARKAQGRPDAA
jgi:hypothetical protein